MQKANWETWLISWCGVHDNRECGDCWAEENKGPRLFSDYTRTPGDGTTECGNNCRCVLLFYGILQVEPGFSEALPGAYMSLKKETGNLFFELIETKQYQEIFDLTVQYERLTSRLYGEYGNWNLPETFYTIKMSAEERIAFLKSLIWQVRTGKFSDSMKAAILRRMAKHWGGEWPERLK